MYRIFATEIRAISPVTGELTLYAGPHIEAISFAMARYYCENNGLGYCTVIGEIMERIEIPNGTNINQLSRYN